MKNQLIFLLMIASVRFYSGISGSGGEVENKGAEIITYIRWEKSEGCALPAPSAPERFGRQ